MLEAVLLLAVGLWTAKLNPSEKGFYAMSFVLALFAAITVQKNIRDLDAYPDEDAVKKINFSKDDEE